MKHGDLVDIKLDNKKYKGVFLGKGRFSKAYLIKTNKGSYVILYGEDCIKDVLALWGDKSNPHEPKIWRYGTNIYLMPYYRPLTKDFEHAWREFKVLHTVWAKPMTETDDYRFLPSYTIDFSYKRIDRFIHLLETEYKKYISQGIIEALKNIYDTVVNCGPNISFEFAPRNLGVDNNGKLVLRDIAFIIRRSHKK